MTHLRSDRPPHILLADDTTLLVRIQELDGETRRVPDAAVRLEITALDLAVQRRARAAEIRASVLDVQPLEGAPISVNEFRCASTEQIDAGNVAFGVRSGAARYFGEIGRILLEPTRVSTSRDRLWRLQRAIPLFRGLHHQDPGEVAFGRVEGSPYLHDGRRAGSAHSSLRTVAPRRDRAPRTRSHRWNCKDGFVGRAPCQHRVRIDEQ
jgi:hypothetical protein